MTPFPETPEGQTHFNPEAERDAHMTPTKESMIEGTAEIMVIILSKYASEKKKRGVVVGALMSIAHTAIEEERARLRKKINAIKTAVRKQTGSFKYDSCYDDVLELLKSNSK